MRIHARTLLFLACCLAVALAAVHFINYRRKATIQTGEFTLRYDKAIQAARAETVALSRKLAQNGAYDPALISMPEPPPAEKQTGAAPAVETITLQGISWSTEMPLALINDKLYVIGQQVGSRTVETILQYSVILRNADGTAMEVTLSEKKSP